MFFCAYKVRNNIDYYIHLPTNNLRLMNSTLYRKSACIVVYSIITTAYSFAQENDFFKQLLKESLKESLNDLITEPLKPEIMMPDSLIRNFKIDLNLKKELPYVEKKLLIISENLFKPYTNPSRPSPSRTGTLNSLTNQITFDNSPGKKPSGIDFNAILTKVFYGKDICKKFDDKIYTESEKESIIGKTNQIIQETRLKAKSDPTP